MFSFQTKSAKILWLLIVCFGFIGSGILIRKSYNEWQESPIATSISTYPLDDLDFPIVTICPPKDSNTALYHDLVKAGNRSLSDVKSRTLRRAAYEIFTEQAHKEYVIKMSATQHNGSARHVSSTPRQQHATSAARHVREFSCSRACQQRWHQRNRTGRLVRELMP